MLNLCPARRGGFTLIEMVMSLVILSVLLLACTSIVMMATRATGDTATRNLSQSQAADAASQMTDDLNVATNFSQRTSLATTFTVPDRLNSGAPQVVSYSWTGTPGDPLLRQFNGGPRTAILANVLNMNLAFNPRLMGPAPAPVEQVLFSHTTGGNPQDYNLDDKNWGAQYFLPNLPVGTSSYTLTRVRLRLKGGPQSAVMNVRLVLPDSSLRPTSTTVAQATVYESSLSSNYEWIDIPFANLTNLNPLQGLCIVLTPLNGGTNIGAIRVDQSIFNILSNAYWSATSNAGISWSLGLGTTTARFSVMGTVP